MRGLKDLYQDNVARIRNGMKAYADLQKMRAGQKDATTLASFEKNRNDLGYGLLLKKYTSKVVDADDGMIAKAAKDSLPKVAPLFWSFRVMVACGFTMLIIFALSFYYCATRVADQKRWLMRLARSEEHTSELQSH